ncbi:MAG TPA: phage head protein, partial [Dehalococcoidia bacterium]|nr:phage head protein [Dehalococcoidia bacterium]
MAQPTNTYDAYDLVGDREDLSDIISNISPTDVPFQSNIGRAKATAILHEFQTDALSTAASNAVIEGDDSAAEAQVATVRASNRTQISKKVVLVTGTANAINKAGRKNELSYLLAKAGKELKRDMEVDLCGKNAAVTGSSSAARKLRGFESWAQTNASRGSGGSDHGSTHVVTDGTQRVFTETMFKAVLQLCFTEGGDPDCVMVGPFNKTKVSGFGGIATLYRDTAGSKGQASIMGAADLYITDWGEVKIVPNRFQRDRTAMVIEKDKWAVAYLRPFRQ